MKILILEFDKLDDNIPTRSIRVIDEEMSLKILFLTYKVDIIEILTGDAHSTGDFIMQVDHTCKITNNNKTIDSDMLYKELEYTEHETDVGIVQMATIQISLKKEQ